MSIDLQTEKVISLAQVGDRVTSYRQGKRVSPSCVLRWILDGVKVSGGGVVKLEGFRIGGRWLTSVEALQRFIDAQTPQPERGPLPRSLRARTRASEKAAQQLEQLGI